MTHRLPVAVQRAKLLARYPGSTVLDRGGLLVWRGTLQPSPMSDRYLVEVKYRAGDSWVDVRVLSPELELHPGKRRQPHVYTGGSLCLHYPPDEDWTPAKAIADTIVPWASEWLFFYESWLVTGEWHGGGHQHGTSKVR